MRPFIINKNTLGLILCLGVMPILSGITGCAGDRYTQSSDESLQDHDTSERVRDALAQDPQHKLFDGVNVKTFKGIVQLSGFVNTKELKIRAGEIARNTTDVHDLRDNISVKD